MIDQKTWEQLKGAILDKYPETCFQLENWVKPQLTSEYVRTLLSHLGIFDDGSKARLVVGQPSSCHGNVAKLLLKNPKWTGWFGFALSGGCWRLHSWAKNTQRRIIETTCPRDVYFGLPMYIPGIDSNPTFFMPDLDL